MLEGGLITARVEGTPQGGPLSPLLSNILLDELDKELERRGHMPSAATPMTATSTLQHRRSGERVMASITRFLSERLKLTVNQSKSSVDRPWKRTFLSYSMTWHRKPRLNIAKKAIARFKATSRQSSDRAGGRMLQATIEETTPKLRGWINYFRYCGS